MINKEQYQILLQKASTLNMDVDSIHEFLIQFNDKIDNTRDTKELVSYIIYGTKKYIENGKYREQKKEEYYIQSISSIQNSYVEFPEDAIIDMLDYSEDTTISIYDKIIDMVDGVEKRMVKLLYDYISITHTIGKKETRNIYGSIYQYVEDKMKIDRFSRLRILKSIRNKIQTI